MSSVRAHTASCEPLDPVTITTEIDSGHFVVLQGSRRADGLGWDEMIGQVIALTHPRIRAPHYDMLTEAERHVQDLRRDLRLAEREVEKERERADG